MGGTVRWCGKEIKSKGIWWTDRKWQWKGLKRRDRETDCGRAAVYDELKTINNFSNCASVCPVLLYHSLLLFFLLINYRRSEQTTKQYITGSICSNTDTWDALSIHAIKTDNVEAVIDTLCFTSHNNCINFPQIRFLMKSYSLIRETAPVIMKNTPKEGNVLYRIDVRCIYASSSVITHTDTARHQRKMTKRELSRLPPNDSSWS